MDNLVSEVVRIFNQIYPISDKTVEQLTAIIEVVSFKGMEDIVKFNSFNKHEYVVLEGVCRSYISNYEGNEATLSFFLEGAVLPPNQIRTIDGKSLFNIQAITPVKVFQFKAFEFANLMTANRDIENWGRKVYDNELKNKVIKELELVTQPAKDRLESFRNRYPNIENLIPHPFIASYLGISPVSLSRLRGKSLH